METTSEAGSAPFRAPGLTSDGKSFRTPQSMRDYHSLIETTAYVKTDIENPGKTKNGIRKLVSLTVLEIVLKF